MRSADEEIREHFPTIQLTMMGVVLALSVERLLDRLEQFNYLWTLTPDSILLWTESIVAIVMISTTWWISTFWFISTRWVTGLADSVVPIGLLLLFYVAIQSMGPDRTTQWLFTLGIGSFATLAYFTRNVRLASKDQSNRVGITPIIFRNGLLVLPIVGVITLAVANH